MNGLININDIKNGMTIIYDGKLYRVQSFQHVKPGKGAAFMKVKLHNLKTGANVEETINSSVKVENLLENMEVQLDFYQGDIIGVTLPEKVEYTVVDTTDAVKGNTTNNAQKDATLENGYVVKVPLFIQQGEKIIVSTIDGKYSSRA